MGVLVIVLWALYIEGEVHEEEGHDYTLINRMDRHVQITRANMCERTVSYAMQCCSKWCCFAISKIMDRVKAILTPCAVVCARSCTLLPTGAGTRKPGTANLISPPPRTVVIQMAHRPSLVLLQMISPYRCRQQRQQLKPRPTMTPKKRLHGSGRHSSRAWQTAAQRCGVAAGHQVRHGSVHLATRIGII